MDDDIYDLSNREERTVKVALVAMLVLAVVWIGFEAVWNSEPPAQPEAKQVEIGSRAKAIAEGAFGTAVD